MWKNDKTIKMIKTYPSASASAAKESGRESRPGKSLSGWVWCRGHAEGGPHPTVAPGHPGSSSHERRGGPGRGYLQDYYHRQEQVHGRGDGGQRAAVGLGDVEQRLLLLVALHPQSVPCGDTREKRQAAAPGCSARPRSGPARTSLRPAGAAPRGRGTHRPRRAGTCTRARARTTARRSSSAARACCACTAGRCCSAGPWSRVLATKGQGPRRVSAPR